MGAHVQEFLKDEGGENESCQTYEWVMSHVCVSRVTCVYVLYVTRVNASCHAYECIQSKETHQNRPVLQQRLCKTLQHTATHCNTLQHTATHRKAQCRLHYAKSPTILGLFCKRDFETRCNTLQHTATHCNTLQHTMQTTSCKEPYNNRALLRKRSSLDLLRERDFSQKRSFVKET